MKILLDKNDCSLNVHEGMNGKKQTIISSGDEETCFRFDGEVELDKAVHVINYAYDKGFQQGKKEVQNIISSALGIKECECGKPL